MRCPVDSVELVMTDRQGIEIDYCPTCRGVWLDRGELDKIIERSTAPVAAQSALDAATGEYRPDHHDPRFQPRFGDVRPDPGYGSGYDPRRDPRSGDPRYGGDRDQRGYDPRQGGYDPRYDKRRKKKAFLEDLFDF
ncbi:zf-TFIIB domain-containing protein [Actinotalea sp. Marseille-Q4924]|uniref:TFIIB-type zinc ribbon-containing protein n=1 Tax=Actinotalea sp. Marseille-Q4924 TaxID=2866571 RepID=UPI001CE41E94|nr:zf-TFIIB domain-containing protein [Actinotalea sp. Marseille-Q4924]